MSSQVIHYYELRLHRYEWESMFRFQNIQEHNSLEKVKLQIDTFKHFFQIQKKNTNSLRWEVHKYVYLIHKTKWHQQNQLYQVFEWANYNNFNEH